MNDSQPLACSPYSRQQAVYPLPWLRERKFWPAVSRVDDGELAIAGYQGCHAYGSDDFSAYGDTNLIVSIPKTLPL